MKKFTLIAILALMVIAVQGGFAAEQYYDLTPTVSGTGTNTFVYTNSAKRATVFPLAVYQDVTTQTNTLTLSITPYGQDTAYSVAVLGSITNTVNYTTIGAGDNSATVDYIWLETGDVLSGSGVGTDATNVSYVIRMKTVID